MPTDEEIRAKFWKALRSDVTVMLGLEGSWAEPARPMTAQMAEEDGHGPIWFFTATDNTLVQELGNDSSRAIATFAAKGHELFATVHGQLSVDTDRAVVDRLWNRFVAAWYEGGKDDPKLQLLRFEPDHAQIWLNENSLFAGLKMLVGVDPKQDYKDKVAKVDLR